MVSSINVIQEFTALLADIRQRLTETRDRVEELERQAEHIEVAIALYRAKRQIPEMQHLITQEPSSDGLTLRERRSVALVTIAKANRSTLVIAEARQALVEAGLFKTPTQFRQQISRLMSEMGCWQRRRGRRGVYRLVESEQQPPLVVRE